MKVSELDIKDVLLLEHQVFKDHRGEFYESFNEKTFSEHTGLNVNFRQDNCSISKKNVFRGLHFQVPPHGQSKLIRVTKGRVIDFFLDLRKASPTYGKLGSVELNESEFTSLFIPEGIAHGFLVLEDDTHFQYKCSELYHPESDRTISIHSVAKLEDSYPELILSQKDLEGIDFSAFDSPF